MSTPGTDELVSAVASYASGLDVELGLLRQLQELSTRQRTATEAGDFDTIRGCTEQRDRLVASLLAVESDIAPQRHLIANNLPRASTIAGFAETATLHRVAESLVASIRETDDLTVAALRAADVTRHGESQSLETAGNTLSAYRRVSQSRISSASLVSSRG